MVTESSLYPNQIDGYSSLPLLRNGIDSIRAENINRVRNAVVATETELGTKPSTNYSVNPPNVWGTVAARLDTIDAYQSVLISSAQYIENQIFVVVGDGVNSVGNFSGSTAAIMQQAINALDSYGGGTVTVRDGYYNFIDGYVLVPSGVRILGTNNVVIANGGYRAIFKTDGSSISIENINFQMTHPVSAFSAPCSAVEISNNSSIVSDITIKSCSFLVDYDAYGVGIYPQNNASVLFDGIKIVDNRFIAGTYFGDPLHINPFPQFEPAFIGFEFGHANQFCHSLHRNMFIEGNIFDSSRTGKAITLVGANIDEFNNIYIGKNSSTSSVDLHFIINTSPSLPNHLSFYKNILPHSSFYFGTIANSSLEGNHFNNLFGLNGSGSTNLIGNNFNASSIYPTTVIYGAGNSPGIYSVGGGSTNSAGIIGTGVDGYGVGGFGVGEGPGGFFIGGPNSEFSVLSIAGDGISGTGAAIAGNGIDGYGTGDGYGVYGVSANITGASGVFGLGGINGGYGISGIGSDNYAGGNFIGGFNAPGMIATGGGNYADGIAGHGAALAGNGIDGYGTGNGVGIYGKGGAFSKTSIYGKGGGNYADGIAGHGATLAGNGVDGYGTGNGVGIYGIGGNSSGVGICGLGGGNYADGIAGYGATLAGNGIDGYGTSTGVGVYGKGSSSGTTGVYGVGGGNYADGIKGYGAALAGNGIDGYGTGEGHGIFGKGAGNGYGIYGVGSNNGTAGILGIGGGNAANGIVGLGSASSGNGVDGYSTGDGYGVFGKGSGTGSGIYGVGSNSGSTGVVGIGNTNYADGIQGYSISGSGNGVDGYGTGTGCGIFGKGGSSGYFGVVGVGGGSYGDGIAGFSAALSGNGIDGYGSGNGAGIYGVGGSSGHGVIATGNSTSAALRIVPQNNTPSSAQEGDAYVSSSNHTFNVYLNNWWQPMANAALCVPYTGATSDVDLGLHTLIAAGSGSYNDGIKGYGSMAGNGIVGIGSGSGYGILGIGGNNKASGVGGKGGGNYADGIIGTGASYIGSGVDGYGTGDGYGIYGIGGSVNGAGVCGQGLLSGLGGKMIGGPSASGLKGIGGGNYADGVVGYAVNLIGNGISSFGTNDGYGAYGVGLSSNSSGIFGQGTGNGVGGNFVGGNTNILPFNVGGQNTSFAVDSTGIYWTTMINDGGPTYVARSDLDGNNVVELFNATNSSDAGALSLDNVNIYWYGEISGNYGINKIDKNGFTGGAQLVQEAATVSAAGNDGYIYWIDYATNVVKKIASSSGFSPVIADELDFPMYTAVDSNYIYWTNAVNGVGSSDGLLLRADKSDGSGQITLASGQNFPYTARNIVVDGDGYVYWTNFNTAGTDGYIMRVDINGFNSPQILVNVADGYYPVGIATDATYVYFTDGNYQKIARIAKNGSQAHPTTIVSINLSPYNGLNAPQGIAVGGDGYAYWTDKNTFSSDGYVMKVNLSNSVTTRLALNQNSPINIVVDTTYVYWTNEGTGSNDGSVEKINKNGTGPLTLASGGNYSWDIAADTNNIYWTDNDFPNGLVWRVVKDGSGQTSIASGRNYPLGIAIDANYVYWVDNGDYIGTGSVSRALLGASTSAITLATSPDVNGPTDIMVDTNYVYWVNNGNGTIKKITKDGITITTLASSQSSPIKIFVDDANIYWTNSGDGTVKKANKTNGSGALTLATGQSNPNGVVVDSTYIYWTNSGDNTAKKASKIDGSGQVTLTNGRGDIFVNSIYLYYANNTSSFTIVGFPFVSANNCTGLIVYGGGNYADGIKGYGAALSGNGIDGYGVGDGIGIYSKSPANYGVVADTNGSYAAPLRVVPQSSVTYGSVGDIYTTTSGVLMSCSRGWQPVMTSVIQTSLWYPRTQVSGYTNSFNGIVFLNIGYLSPIFCAVGNVNSAGSPRAEIETSVNGVTWTRQNPGSSYAGNFNGIATTPSGSLVVAVGSRDAGTSTTAEIQTSVDGCITWFRQSVTSGFAGTFYAVGYNGLGLFCAVGSSNGTRAEIETSFDAVNWSRQNAGSVYNGTFYDVAHNGLTGGNALWVAVGSRDAGTSTTAEIQTSADGTTWTRRTTANSFNGTFYAVAYGGGLWVAVGTSGEIQTSSDGINWVHRSPASSYSGQFNGIFHDGIGQWCAVGASGEVETSIDGITWTKQMMDSSLTLRAITYGFGSFVIVGGSGVIRQSLAIV